MESQEFYGIFGNFWDLYGIFGNYMESLEFYRILGNSWILREFRIPGFRTLPLGIRTRKWYPRNFSETCIR
jgi:hypothetical protein